MTIDGFAQIGIMIFGVTAVWLCTSTERRRRKIASILGLCAQPLWLYTTLSHGQYPIAALTLLYGAGWIGGIVRNWRP